MNDPFIDILDAVSVADTTEKNWPDCIDKVPRGNLYTRGKKEKQASSIFFLYLLQLLDKF